MKKTLKIVLSVTVLVSLLAISGAVFADTANQSTITNPLAGGGVNSVGDLVKNFATVFAYVVVIFAVLALIWTGLQFITAQGNIEKLKELKTRLLYIVIGVAIVIGARIIVNVVINTLSATGVVNQNVINSAKDAASTN